MDRQIYHQFHKSYRGILISLYFLFFMHNCTQPDKEFYYLKEKFCKEVEPFKSANIDPKNLPIINHGTTAMCLYGILLNTIECFKSLEETDKDTFDEIQEKINTYLLQSFRDNFDVYKPQDEQENLEFTRIDLVRPNRKITLTPYEIIDNGKQGKLQTSVYQCLKNLRNGIAHCNYQVNIEKNWLVFHNENKNKITQVFYTNPLQIYSFIDAYRKFIGKDVFPIIEKQLN